METLVLQVEARHGRVAEFARSSGDNLSVGRAYDNDMVLTDHHVARHQLRFFREGEQWFFTIIDQVNPVLLNKRSVAGSKCAVGAGDEITVGRTRLQVYSIDHVVEPTRKLMVSNLLALENIGPFLPLATLVCLSLVDLVINFFFSSTDLKWLEQVYAVLFSAAITVLWAGLWAIAGRILRQQHHFGLQLIVASGFSILMTFLTIAASYIAFYAFDAGTDEFFGWLVYGFALLILLRLNFMIATNVQRSLLASFVGTALLLAAGYGMYYHWGDEEFEYAPVHSQVLIAPPLLFKVGESPQEYFDDVGDVFQAISR